MVLASVFLLVLNGCTITGVPVARVEVTAPEVEVGVAPVEDLSVQYDDPRGWYIEGYWAPGHVWVAPFWTTDAYVLHDHFAYYHGRHHDYFARDHFQREGFRKGLAHRERSGRGRPEAIHRGGEREHGGREVKGRPEGRKPEKRQE